MECRIDDRIAEYEIDGSKGEWVVIIQGWGTEYSIYAGIAALLSERYRVLRFDLPGFGHSEEPEHAYSVEEYADWTLRLLGQLGIERATLIGHSYGGRVIIRLASRESLPIAIEKIVLIDAAGVLPQRTPAQLRRQRRYKRLKRLADNHIIYEMFPDLIDDWRSRQGSEDYRRATPLMRQALVMAVNEDLCGLMPRVTQETLLIWGDKDTATPLSDGQTMERLMPNAALTVIEGVGHFSFAEAPETFNAILSSFLQVKKADTADVAAGQAGGAI